MMLRKTPDIEEPRRWVAGDSRTFYRRDPQIHLERVKTRYMIGWRTVMYRQLLGAISSHCIR